MGELHNLVGLETVGEGLGVGNGLNTVGGRGVLVTVATTPADLNVVGVGVGVGVGVELNLVDLIKSGRNYTCK